MDTPWLLTETISGLIAVENDLGLLLALEILNDSVAMAEQTILDSTLLEMSGILKKEMNLFYQRGQNETFHPLF